MSYPNSTIPEDEIVKKILTAVLAAAVGLACLAGCSSQSMQSTANAENANSKVQVVASFYPMADFAKKIGGDRVQVMNLVPAGTEPHDWEPSTNDMKTLSSAKLFIYNGAGMEKWVDNTLSSIGNDSLVQVEASKGITLRTAAKDEHEEEEGEEEHESSQYDPHVWLSPMNTKAEMANIRDGLIKADPDGESVYRKNYEKYASELDALDQEYKDQLAKTTSKNIVVSHQAFGYLCDAYGLNQLAIEGIDADSEPDAKTMATIADFVKQNNVKTIFSEELVSPKVAQTIADETGATCEELNPLEGLSDDDLAAGKDYFSVMRENLGKLVKALS
jgi:zinc transport system substrate-binding protein